MKARLTKPFYIRILSIPRSHKSARCCYGRILCPEIACPNMRLSRHNLKFHVLIKMFPQNCPHEQKHCLQLLHWYNLSVTHRYRMYSCALFTSIYLNYFFFHINNDLQSLWSISLPDLYKMFICLNKLQPSMENLININKSKLFYHIDVFQINILFYQEIFVTFSIFRFSAEKLNHQNLSN